MHTDSVLLSIMIDAYKNRDVAVADIKGAYLLTKINEFIIIKLEDKQVDIMYKIDSKYKQFIEIENGKKVLYLILNSELYGTLQGAILWYKLLVSKLISFGFKLNPYDLYVANAMVDRS